LRLSIEGNGFFTHGSSSRVVPDLTQLDTFDFVAFRRALLRWYRVHGRTLPWREMPDPYRVWISEIMLQQTTVTAVIPYFEKFLARFPTLIALARSDEHEVLRLWEGLGYYSRARNIHRCAQVVVAEHAGNFPNDLEQLQALPGIGRYTAGAIASLAFNLPAPILEANTIRTHARLLAFQGDPRSPAGQQLLWGFAERVVSPKQSGAINHALMDLGATVCRPEPLCDRCPVLKNCRAYAAGAQREIPTAARRPVITAVTEYAVAVRRQEPLGGKSTALYLLMKRPAGERWAGLWDFIRFPAIDGEAATADWLSGEVLRRVGVNVDIEDRLPDIRHSVTRYKITLECHRALYLSETPTGTTTWVSADNMPDYPLSKPARNLAERLRNSLY